MEEIILTWHWILKILAWVLAIAVFLYSIYEPKAKKKVKKTPFAQRMELKMKWHKLLTRKK